MKKVFTLVLILVALLSCMGAYASTYPTAFVVVEVDEVSDVLVLEDFNGFLWEWYGIEDTLTGDVMAAIIDDNNTAEVFDDEIVCLRYCGWLDGWR